jgi:hypothetical protein
MPCSCGVASPHNAALQGRRSHPVMCSNPAAFSSRWPLHFLHRQRGACQGLRYRGGVTQAVVSASELLCRYAEARYLRTYTIICTRCRCSHDICCCSQRDAQPDQPSSVDRKRSDAVRRSSGSQRRRMLQGGAPTPAGSLPGLFVQACATTLQRLE